MAVGFQTWKSTVFELSCIRKKLPITMNLKETVDRRFCVRCCFAAVPQLVDRNSEAY